MTARDDIGARPLSPEALKRGRETLVRLASRTTAAGTCALDLLPDARRLLLRTLQARAERLRFAELVDASLHPNGRCTCFAAGECAWCVQTERWFAEGPKVGDLVPAEEVPESALVCLRHDKVQVFAVRRPGKWFRRWRWTFADGSSKLLWLLSSIMPEMWESATIIALDVPAEATPAQLDALVAAAG